MQNSQTIKFGYFIVLFMMVMLLPANGFSVVQQADNWLDEPVTIRFQNESLSKMLEKISKKTGIAILYDLELANEKVSGNYKDVKASDAITRLFNGKNKSIQVNKAKKIIIVKTFGAKSFIWAGSVDEGGEGERDSGPMTLADLGKMHDRQSKSYRERIANNNEILEGGMTRGELRTMQEQQYEDYQERIANDNEVVEGGMTRGQLRTMHEEQHQANLRRLSDDNEILEGGITRGDLRILQEQQHKVSLTRLSNDSKIVGDGITRGQLRNMQEQQLKEYRKRQNELNRIIE